MEAIPALLWLRQRYSSSDHNVPPFLHVSIPRRPLGHSLLHHWNLLARRHLHHHVADLLCTSLQLLRPSSRSHEPLLLRGFGYWHDRGSSSD